MTDMILDPTGKWRVVYLWIAEWNESEGIEDAEIDEHIEIRRVVAWYPSSDIHDDVSLKPMVLDGDELRVVPAGSLTERDVNVIHSVIHVDDLTDEVRRGFRSTWRFATDEKGKRGK